MMEITPAQTPNDVIFRAEALREATRKIPLSPAHIAQALHRVMALWQARLENNWKPPEDGAFPWEMVRFGLAGLASSPLPVRQMSSAEKEAGKNGLVALICAGNTPLLAWPTLCAGLLAGASVYVKMSRHETLWPRLFVQSLCDANAPELAARVHLDVWPGSDAKTAALVQAADAVVAYGSDASVAALKNATPAQTPFFGFGHALSVGVWTKAAWQEEAVRNAAHGFARDIMMYGQGGCLSPHTLFVEVNADNKNTLPALCESLHREMCRAAESLHAPPVTDAAVARTLREAGDMAHFDGHSVWANENHFHHGMVIRVAAEQEMPPPIGHGVVFVVPISDVRALPERFGRMRGKISSVGVAGSLPAETEALLRADGVSRICEAGTMQAPPLDWPNGNCDLFSALPNALR